MSIRKIISLTLALALALGLVTFAAADEDASIKIPQAVDAARVKRRVACPCIALAKRREKVF